MRFLFGFYVTWGLLHLAAVAACAALQVRMALQPKIYPPLAPAGETSLILAICGSIAVLPLAAAFGLWRRSRITRLVLLGISWWYLLASPILVIAAVLEFAGVRLPNGVLVVNRPIESILFGLAFFAYAVWQCHVLTTPAVRQEFNLDPGRVSARPNVEGGSPGK